MFGTLWNHGWRLLLSAGIELNNQGLIKSQDGSTSDQGGSLRTSADNIYAGGDMVRGADLVVTAVAEGIKAAQEIITKYHKV